MGGLDVRDCSEDPRVSCAPLPTPILRTSSPVKDIGDHRSLNFQDVNHRLQRVEKLCEEQAKAICLMQSFLVNSRRENATTPRRESCPSAVDLESQLRQDVFIVGQALRTLRRDMDVQYQQLATVTQQLPTLTTQVAIAVAALDEAAFLGKKSAVSSFSRHDAVASEKHPLFFDEVE